MSALGPAAWLGADAAATVDAQKTVNDEDLIALVARESVRHGAVRKPSLRTCWDVAS